jgi:hypothetical protein
MMEDTPKELDWVSERAKCKIAAAFTDLLLAVKKDVDQYNAISNLTTNYQISMKEDPSGYGFTVSRNSNFVKTVIFIRTASSIDIATGYPSGNRTLTAIPMLTESGRCKFEVDGKQFEQWQLRRQALEEVFFADPFA